MLGNLLKFLNLMSFRALSNAPQNMRKKVFIFFRLFDYEKQCDSEKEVCRLNPLTNLCQFLHAVTYSYRLSSGVSAVLKKRQLL